MLAGAKTPVTIAVNKVDRLNRAATAAVLQQASELELDCEIFPISARTGAGVPALVDHLHGLMPEGPLMFAPDDAPTSRTSCCWPSWCARR